MAGVNCELTCFDYTEVVEICNLDKPSAPHHVSCKHPYVFAFGSYLKGAAADLPEDSWVRYVQDKFRRSADAESYVAPLRTGGIVFPLAAGAGGKKVPETSRNHKSLRVGGS